jgi:hypothetical protein
MRIRSEQMAFFSNASLKTFEDRVLPHLNKCFPAQCAALGEPELRSTIQYGITRAASYGITTEREVCKYIDLMVVFGRDFDRDPTLPWVSAILNGRHWRTPTVKLEHLYQTAKEQLRKGASGNGEL